MVYETRDSDVSLDTIENLIYMLADRFERYKRDDKYPLLPGRDDIDSSLSSRSLKSKANTTMQRELFLLPRSGVYLHADWGYG